MNTKLHALVAMTIVAALGGGVSASLPWDRVYAMASRPPVVGSPAPNFELLDLQGRHVRLQDYRGRVVLLNFWATWCKPCVKEMPAMQRTYEELGGEGFEVLAINELEDETRVREHIREHGHTFTVLLDKQNRVANMYGVKGLPVSVFIDQSGRVREYVKGGLLTEEKIRRTVEQILAEGPGEPSSSAQS